MSNVDRIDPAFGNWLAGFADGEGCFFIGRVTHRNRKGGPDYVNYRCAFTISLRNDDRPILEEIRATLGIGSMGHRAPRNMGVWPMCEWRVKSKPEAVVLVDLFDRYPLRAKKARDYAIWREAVIDWNSRLQGGGRHNGRHDWSNLARLHQELKDVRKYA